MSAALQSVYKCFVFICAAQAATEVEHGIVILKINEDKTLVKLKPTIDTKYGSVMEYSEIFMQCMVLCREAAEKLELQFKLIINEQQLI